MNIRKATSTDLDFLIHADFDTYTQGALAHREQIKQFIEDEDKGAYVCEVENGKLVGMILWRYRNRLTEILPEWSVFNHIDKEIFPPDGNFCEPFQLWVEPEYRQKGIATQLKLHVETDARMRGVKMIYTHTASDNSIVLHLNQKLGYNEVRRGKIWDEVERVSLVKTL
jgi:ribosomal protein S18 acetylase RimI-like enzyme